MSHATDFLAETAEIARALDPDAIDALARALAALRDNHGRLFVLGLGGGAGNCGHAVNDFRKLCSIEAYAPTDNVSELTARTNDDGFETIFVEFLRTSRADEKDAIFVFSVGGGNQAHGVSLAIVHAVDEAKRRGMKVFGVVGRDGGHTHANGDNVIRIPEINSGRITPHTEGYQAVVWHCLVSDPVLQVQSTKW